MINENFSAILYLISSVFFILALKGLSSPETARRGNIFGILGMLTAVSTLILQPNTSNFISNFITENKTFDIEAKDELLLKTTLVKNGNKTENFYGG